ncbi:hypothetical protein T484DRAFT_1822599 [Baffinella frigidus]|nr:hypothetical protein T484DRAFT_1822599 [Cryptophyta sp. CCMP2293]
MNRRVHNEELLGFVRGIKGTSVQVAIHERGLALISQPAGNLFGRPAPSATNRPSEAARKQPEADPEAHLLKGMLKAPRPHPAQTPPSPDMDTKTFLRAQKNMRKRMVLLQHLLEGPQGRLHEEHPRWQEPLGAHVRFVFNRAGFRAMRRVLRTPRVLGNILPAILEAPNQPAAPPQQHPAPPARGPPKPAERVRQAQLQQLFGAAPEEQPAQGASGQEEAAMQSVQVQSGALAKRKRVFDQTLNAEQIESVQRMLDGWEAPSAG